MHSNTQYTQYQYNINNQYNNKKMKWKRKGKLYKYKIQKFNVICNFSN